MQHKRFLLLVLLHSHPCSFCCLCVRVWTCVECRMCWVRHALLALIYTIPSPPVKRFACSAFLVSFLLSFFSFMYTHLDGHEFVSMCRSQYVRVSERRSKGRKEQRKWNKNEYVLSTRALTRLQDQRSTRYETSVSNVIWFGGEIIGAMFAPSIQLFVLCIALSFAFSLVLVAFAVYAVWLTVLDAMNSVYLFSELFPFAVRWIWMQHMLMFIRCVRNMRNRKENAQHDDKFNGALYMYQDTSAIAIAIRRPSAMTASIQIQIQMSSISESHTQLSFATERFSGKKNTASDEKFRCGEIWIIRVAAQCRIALHAISHHRNRFPLHSFQLSSSLTKR